MYVQASSSYPESVVSGLHEFFAISKGSKLSEYVQIWYLRVRQLESLMDK